MIRSHRGGRSYWPEPRKQCPVCFGLNYIPDGPDPEANLPCPRCPDGTVPNPEWVLMQRQVRWGVIGLLLVGALLIAAAIVTLSGCASTGLYQMSDQWCAAHPEASSARCPR